MNFTQTWNPTISAEQRNKAVEECNQAIDLLKIVLEERRRSPQQDDFLSELIKIEHTTENFDDWDILTLILALVGAGADTTLNAQQWMVYCLLKHPEQIDMALSSSAAFANAFSEINRWSINAKMGFARYAPQDMKVLGQAVRKGQMVLLMPHLSKHDPDHFKNPETFDVTRTFDPDLLFGYGPRYCIGAALAKRQLYLSMSELHRRFPNARLAGEPEIDATDHNAIAFKNMMIKTNI